jgi:PAS domain S-box-containing protein
MTAHIEAARDGTRSVPGATARHSATILLVDDYDANLTALEAILDPIGAVLVKASSGEEALEQVLHREFALILLDIRMNGIDGIETAAQIRSHHRTRDVPMILLTAYELDDEDLRRAYASGVVDVLRKPLLPEVVRAKAMVFVELFLQRDQNRRQQSALKLRQKESEDLLQLIVEQSGEGIIVVDENGVLRIFNPAGQEQHGTVEPPVIDGSPLERALRGEEVKDAEWIVHRPDGAERILTGTASPLQRADGTSAGAVLISRDVTKRKQAEARQAFMMEANELLASSLDYEATLSAVVRSAVPRVADWCAIDILVNGGEVQHLAVSRDDDEMQRFFRAQVVPWVLETGKSAREHSYLSVPLRAGDRTLGALTLARVDSGREFDETELRFAEDLGRRAGLFLDNALLYREAQHKTETLERRNRDLDQFAYIASHDLKAPLRGIANLSQWLEDDIGASLEEESKAQLQLLRSRVRRMEALIDGILSYSRAGRTKGKDEPVAVRALLDEVVELLSPVGIAISFGDELPTLKTEKVLLQQVFMNLIGNAIKHGGRSDLSVRVEASDLGSHYEFAVVDDGVGIAAEYHDKIWGVFQTLVRRDEVEGTGIGLAVVKKIVELVGGRAWVESQAGAGATFKFTWPKTKKRFDP